MANEMQNKSLSISVCMATYNGAVFIEEQLRSILAQLPNDAEVLIADDGSADTTLEKVNAFHDSRIKIIEPVSTSTPLGPIYNLERALAKANGRYIFLADQDDVWLEGKVARVLSVLEQSSATARKQGVLVLHDAYLLVPAEEKCSEFCRAGRLSDIRPFAVGAFRNWFKNGYTGCCMAFERTLLDRTLPFPKNLPMHDQWLGLVAERFMNVVYLDEPLVEYRQHKKNATHIAGGTTSLVQKFKWRLNLMRALLSR